MITLDFKHIFTIFFRTLEKDMTGLK